MTERDAWRLCAPFLLTAALFAAVALLLEWTRPVLVLRQSPAAVYPVAVELDGRCVVAYRLQEVTAR